MEDLKVNLDKTFTDLESYFGSGATRPYDFRIEMLNSLERLVTENINDICAALSSDLRKPKHEALLSEISIVLEEIKLTKKKLKKWMRPQCAGAPLGMFPSKNRIFLEPLGVVLIIGPWNYPFQLLMGPLVGAIAAGNCTLLKPSELTRHTSALVKGLISKYFAKSYITVVEGGIPETTELLNQKFNHIFFTGSTTVGKIVMQAASKNLTPVTLELGGKSPVIVNEDADLDLAARRIAWGKLYNAGQTCIAPDYLYVHEAIFDILLKKVKENIIKQFGTDQKKSADLARIVSVNHHKRLSSLIDKNKIFYGGDTDESNLYIQPTILKDVNWSDPVMKEEIFGPILAVMTFSSLTDVFTTISNKPKPLAAYFFSKSKELQNLFVKKLSFGGGCINDVLMHFGNAHLPFGGVGHSGFGNYHGKNSFKTFSHEKSIMFRSGFLDLSARYAPYTNAKTNLLKKIFGVK